jgi:hypothetical protein
VPSTKGGVSFKNKPRRSDVRNRTAQGTSEPNSHGTLRVFFKREWFGVAPPPPTTTRIWLMTGGEGGFLRE